MVADAEVELDLTWLFGFLGTSLETDRLDSILKSLDIEVTAKKDSTWSLLVPAYRSDVTRPADVAEEILRIHGFDHIPLPERMTGTLEIPMKPNREDVLLDGVNCSSVWDSRRSCRIRSPKLRTPNSWKTGIFFRRRASRC